METVHVFLPLIQTVVIFAMFALLAWLGRFFTGRPQTGRRAGGDADPGFAQLGWLLAVMAVGTAVLCLLASRVLADLGIAAGLGVGSMVAGRVCVGALRGDHRPRRAAVAPSGRRWVQ